MSEVEPNARRKKVTGESGWGGRGGLEEEEEEERWKVKVGGGGGGGGRRVGVRQSGRV